MLFRSADCQALSGVFVDQGHKPDAAAIMRLGRHKVIAPDVITPLRAQANARAVVQPQATTGTLFLGNFQALPAPDATDTVLANIPPGLVEQGRDPAIAVTTILRPQCDDGPRQPIFISSNRGDIALRSPWLTDNAAGPAFREPITLPSYRDCLPPPVGR